MKNFLKILGLTCVTTLVVLSSQANTTLPYKITGEFVYIEPVVDEEPAEAEADAPEALPREPVDLSNAVLTISYETTNEDGEAETVTLYQGPYKDVFENVGEVTEPTKVNISLQIFEDSDPMTIDAVLGTNSDVRFAYVDVPGPQDEFELVGSDNRSLNPEIRFSISGNLGFLGFDTSTASVYVSAMYFDEDGQSRYKEWGPVLLKNDSFLIAGDVDRPMLASMSIAGENYYTASEIILEPRGDLVVSQLGNQIEELGVASSGGFHAMLVESWQQKSEYISMIEAYADEYAQYTRRWKAGEPEPEADVEGDSDVAESKTSSGDSSDSADIVDAVVPAVGCEDAAAQESDIPDSSYSQPKYYVLYDEAMEIRNETLKEIAEGDGDPMVRYLAIDMSPYDWLDPSSQLAALQPLVEEFDEQFVASYINPKIERLERRVMLVNNDAVLVPGQRVPEFVLANYDEEDKSLYDLLAEKDMVLIDFWASWCGPCIADFPELKKLHTAYTDEDFEIIGVSIDSTVEAWKGGVDEHELPWINLGEVKGWEGPVSTLYGVNAIPKGFLVDSKGCIYKKNIRPAALKDFLVDRYGMDESLEEPDEETDDTPEVSG